MLTLSLVFFVVAIGGRSSDHDDVIFLMTVLLSLSLSLSLSLVVLLLLHLSFMLLLLLQLVSDFLLPGVVAVFLLLLLW